MHGLVTRRLFVVVIVFVDVLDYENVDDFINVETSSGSNPFMYVYICVCVCVSVCRLLASAHIVNWFITHHSYFHL